MQEEIEVWKDVLGYEGIYQVSNIGSVRGLDREIDNPINKSEKGKLLKKSIKRGYQCVVLQGKTRRKYISIHRLVAINFMPNPYGKPQVNHINGIKTDNRIENLEWVTSKENINHAWENDLCKSRKGISHPNSKLTDEMVSKIKSMKGVFIHKEIALKFNISRSVVQSILSSKAWIHIK